MFQLILYLLPMMPIEPEQQVIITFHLDYGFFFMHGLVWF
jgi:hypothetical protein